MVTFALEEGGKKIQEDQGQSQFGSKSGTNPLFLYVLVVLVSLLLPIQENGSGCAWAGHPLVKSTCKSAAAPALQHDIQILR